MIFFKKNSKPAFLRDISKVFSHRIRTFGSTPAGVLWKSSEGQALRFEVLSGILDDICPSTSITINDFGCGYGALLDFINELPSLPEVTYFGYDISEEMINVAKKRNHHQRATFTKASKVDKVADFTFISGTFNLSLNVDAVSWNNYVKSSLSQIWSMSRAGLAFNMLDNCQARQTDGLYYADSNEFIDFCSNFSSNLTLIKDYPLNEWTIFIHR